MPKSKTLMELAKELESSLTAYNKAVNGLAGTTPVSNFRSLL